MAERVHTGRGGGFLRESDDKLGIHDRVIGNDVRVHDGVLMVRLGVGDHGGHGGLGTCAGGRGNGNEGRDILHYLQKTREIVERGTGTRTEAGGSLGGVDGRAAADGKKAVAALFHVHVLYLVNGSGGGIRCYLGIMYGLKTRETYILNDLGRNALSDVAAGHDQHLFYAQLFKYAGYLPAAAAARDGDGLAESEKLAAECQRRSFNSDQRLEHIRILR